MRYAYAINTNFQVFARIESGDFSRWISDRYRCGDGWQPTTEEMAHTLMNEWDEVWDWPVTYTSGTIHGITAQFSIDRAWYEEHRAF